jgi:hypothetical protein
MKGSCSVRGEKKKEKRKKEKKKRGVLDVVGWCLRVGLRPTSAGLVGLRPKPVVYVVLLDRHMTGM